MTSLEQIYLQKSVFLHHHTQTQHPAVRQRAPLCDFLHHVISMFRDAIGHLKQVLEHLRRQITVVILNPFTERTASAEVRAPESEPAAERLEIRDYLGQFLFQQVVAPLAANVVDSAGEHEHVPVVFRGQSRRNKPASVLLRFYQYGRPGQSGDDSVTAKEIGRSDRIAYGKVAD